MSQDFAIPHNIIPLLRLLDNRLVDLLRSLSPVDWKRQTVAKLWTVKDVVAHLLDGNIRILSMLRDGYFGEAPAPDAPGGLLRYLNQLNADWVKAMQRVSPGMLILLHETTGRLFIDYYATLDPRGKATFPVAWAGEEESLNWMHLAREYTEKWLHQQQIRETLNDQTLISKEFFNPFIDIFMYGLPVAYRDVQAVKGICVKVTIPGEAGGSWQLVRGATDWYLNRNKAVTPDSNIIIDAKIAWKLFSKSVRPSEVRKEIIIDGDVELGEVALSMVSVMA